MARARLSIGTFGDINFHVTPSGNFEARTRYRDRDWGGRARQLQGTGTTSKAAERAEDKIAERYLFQATDTNPTPDSLFSALVTYWLNDIGLEDWISRTTRILYERNMRTLSGGRLRGTRANHSTSNHQEGRSNVTSGVKDPRPFVYDGARHFGRINDIAQIGLFINSSAIEPEEYWRREKALLARA